MAKIYLDSGDNFTLSSTASVFGSTGTEKVVVNSGVTGADINANVERVDLAGASSAYTYQQVGNFLKVYSGTTLVATVYPQDDTDGTQLVFSNGSVSLKISTAGITLGGATVPSAAAAAVTPTTIDATVTSGSGSSTGSSNGTYTVTSDMDTVVEGKTATFTVTRSGDVTAAKTLTFNASGDTNNTTVAAAAAGVDASPASGTVTFAAGATTATFTVSAAADTAVEGLEGLRVRLFDGTTAVADKVVLINDDTTGTTVPGNTYTLTTGTDNITGTSGNDTVNASGTELTTGDNINGGAGTDTLNLTMAGVGAPIATLAGVENVTVSAGVTSNTSGPINAVNWTGVEKLTVKGLGVALTGANGTNTGWSFTNLQQNTAVGVENVATANDNDAAIYAGFASGKVGSSTATLTLNLGGAVGNTASTGVANVIVDTAGTDKFTKLAINSTGTNRVQLEGTAAAEIDLTEITVAGAGSTTFSVDATNAVVTNLATVNAGSATGAFTADISASTKAVTFTGSAGKNTVTFGNSNNVITGGAADDTFTVGSGNNTITGGAGNDAVVTAVASLTKSDVIALGDGTRDEIRYSDVTTLNVAGVDATALAALNAQTGVEVVGSSAAVTAIDAGYFTQNVFNLTGALTAAVTATNIAGDTIAFTSGLTGVNGDALTVSGALPNQTLTIELGGAAAVKLEATDGGAGNTALTVASGISTVNLVSSTTATTGTITNEIGLAAATTATHVIDNVSAGSFVLTGSTNLTIESGLTAGFTKAVDFNASAFTGKLSIVGSAEADVIKGGSGADTINGHDGDDVLTGGAGADTFVFVSGHGSAAPSATVFEQITDYAKGSDIIDWDANLTIDTATAAAVAGTAQVNSEGIATFHADDDTLAERLVAATKGMDADGDFVVFEFGSDTYVYISGDSNATQDVADALIKLVGVTGITDTTIDANNNLVLA